MSKHPDGGKLMSELTQGLADYLGAKNFHSTKSYPFESFRLIYKDGYINQRNESLSNVSDQ